jgi:hypothetical protein
MAFLRDLNGPRVGAVLHDVKEAIPDDAWQRGTVPVAWERAARFSCTIDAGRAAIAFDAKVRRIASEPRILERVSLSPGPTQRFLPSFLCR